MPLFKRKREIEERSLTFSISDPAFASWLYGPSIAGVTVTNETALGVPALWRAINLISATVASLPMKVYREGSDGSRIEVKGTWVENPCPWMTPFSFTKLIVTHLALDGNAFLLHIYGGAGQIIGFQPLHPSCVNVEWDDELGTKVFKVSYEGRNQTFTSLDITHIHGLTLDGLRGLSPIFTCRNAIGTAIAGNEAAARMFANGGMVSGIVTSEEDLPEDEARLIKQDLDNRLAGTNNAGSIAFVNRNLKFEKWQMTADEAEFVDQRQFSVEEIARLTGVPKVLLASDGASTWGAGIRELNRGLARYVLPDYIKPIEEAFSVLLARPRWVEFEMKALLQGTPEEEIPLLIQQVQAGLLTPNEARAIINLPPLEEPSLTMEDET